MRNTKKHADLIETGVGKNPRALKRFSNLLLFFDALANNLKTAVCAGQEVSPGNKELMKKFFVPLPYLKWSLIAHNFPRVYEEIKKDPKTLIKLQNAATGGEKAKETGGEEGGVISGIGPQTQKNTSKGGEGGAFVSGQCVAHRQVCPSGRGRGNTVLGKGILRWIYGDLPARRHGENPQGKISLWP